MPNESPNNSKGMLTVTSLQETSLWLPHPLVALEAMKLVFFKLPAMPNLSLCAVRYSKE